MSVEHDTPLPREALRSLLLRLLAAESATWSVGGWGAVAELHPAAGAGIDVAEHTDRIEAATQGGRLAVALRGGVRCLARGAARYFCLPAAEAAGPAREALTECGALGGAPLFDIGVGLPNVDALVRIDEAALAQCLRRASGRRIVGSHEPALAALIAASPPRLFRSALAEIEVGGPIASTTTPDGPHTHVLPDLLAERRTHDPRVELPEGWLPCLVWHGPPESARTDHPD